MFGIAELLLTGLSLSGLVGALVLLARQTGTTRPRGPFPIIPAVLAAVSLVLALLLGGALSPVFLAHLSTRFPPVHSELLFSPGDLGRPLIYAGALLATWLALPGLGALAWLALSRDRVPSTAAFFGASVGLGFTVGAGLGLELGVPQLRETLIASTPDALIAMADASRMAIAVSFASGLGGALSSGVWFVSSRSKRTMRTTLFASLLVPFGCLLVAAVLTPPDVLTQLLVAAPLGLCWLLGLALGGATHLLRRSR